MPNETEEIIKQVIDKVNKNYELEATDEGYTKRYVKGYKEGWDRSNKQIAFNMKGKYSPEEISKITGLNVETIENLENPQNTKNKEMRKNKQLNETGRIIAQVINDVNRKYELEAFDEGYDKGRESGYKIGKQDGEKQGRKNLAFKMKGENIPEELTYIPQINPESIKNPKKTLLPKINEKKMTRIVINAISYIENEMELGEKYCIDAYNTGYKKGYCKEYSIGYAEGYVKGYTEENKEIGDIMIKLVSTMNEKFFSGDISFITGLPSEIILEL